MADRSYAYRPVNKFTKRITLLKQTATTDAECNHVNTWAMVAILWADVRDVNSKEQTEAGETVYHQDITVNLRWNEYTKDVDTVQYRVMFEDVAYNIIRIDHLEYFHKEIKLTCRQERV